LIGNTGGVAFPDPVRPPSGAPPSHPSAQRALFSECRASRRPAGPTVTISRPAPQISPFFSFPFFLARHCARSPHRALPRNSFRELPLPSCPYPVMPARFQCYFCRRQFLRPIISSCSQPPASSVTWSRGYQTTDYVFLFKMEHPLQLFFIDPRPPPPISVFTTSWLGPPLLLNEVLLLGSLTFLFPVTEDPGSRGASFTFSPALWRFTMFERFFSHGPLRLFFLWVLSGPCEVFFFAGKPFQHLSLSPFWFFLSMLLALRVSNPLGAAPVGRSSRMILVPVLRNVFLFSVRNVSRSGLYFICSFTAFPRPVRLFSGAPPAIVRLCASSTAYRAWLL